MQIAADSKATPRPTFSSAQIVCLEHGTSRLYAEVVQTVEATQICWVRPLLLMDGAAVDDPVEMQPVHQLIDLRQGSDLLLPIALFRGALDVEVIPLLAQLGEVQERVPLRHQRQLNHLIRQVCHANPALFQDA